MRSGIVTEARRPPPLLRAVRVDVWLSLDSHIAVACWSAFVARHTGLNVAAVSHHTNVCIVAMLCPMGAGDKTVYDPHWSLFFWFMSSC